MLSGDYLACQANQPPSLSSLTPIEVSIGSTISKTIDSTVIKQCQDEGVTLIFYYENMATAATTKNNFITWSSTTNTLTVDASSSNAKAGFRAVFFYACNKIFTAQCAYVA